MDDEEIWRAQEAMAEAEVRAQRERMALAEKRSLDFLLGMLDEAQRRQAGNVGSFDIVRPYGVYRIQVANGTTYFNPPSECTTRGGFFVCISPLREWGYLPGPDHALAKKLMIDGNEDLFWRTCNAGQYTLDWARLVFVSTKPTPQQQEQEEALQQLARQVRANLIERAFWFLRPQG